MRGRASSTPIPDVVSDSDNHRHQVDQPYQGHSLRPTAVAQSMGRCYNMASGGYKCSKIRMLPSPVPHRPVPQAAKPKDIIKSSARGTDCVCLH